MKVKKQGISLILLVITIIVIVILAGAVVLNLFDGNIIDDANEAVSKNDQAVLEERKYLFEMEAILSEGNDYNAEKVLYCEAEGKYYYDEDINGDSVTTDDGNGSITVDLDSSILVEDYNGQVIAKVDEENTGDEETIVDNPIENVDVSYPDEYANLFDGNDSTYYVSSDYNFSDYITLNEDLSGKYMCVEYMISDVTNIDEYTGGTGMCGPSLEYNFLDSNNSYLSSSISLEYSIDEDSLYCADFNGSLGKVYSAMDNEKWFVGIASVPENVNKIGVFCKTDTSNDRLIIKRMNFYNSLDDISGYEKALEIIDIDNGTVNVPNNITSIGNYAFYCSESLVSITIPSTVTSIGREAFGNCDSLTSIEIPSSVTSIGSGAFWECDSLTSIEIPSSVTSIGSEAFWSCGSLTSIEISSGVISIGSEVFWNCDSLTSIEIPSSVTSIGSGAFSACNSLTNIRIYKPEGSISGAPWGASNAIITWDE